MEFCQHRILISALVNWSGQF